MAENTYEIIAEAKQSQSIFTQGLELDNDHLYISSGLYGKSFIKSVADHKSDRKMLPPHVFAEGITIVGDNIYMLTWKAGRMYTLNKHTFEPIGETPYQGEGWGLTHNDEHFFMSNGSHYIQYRKLDDFSLEKYVRITHNKKVLPRINELEYAKGSLWANVWFSNSIYKIDPESGHVLNSWDLSDVVDSLGLTDKRAVLNGIAYDPNKDAFWITGKLWPKRLLIRFKSNS